MTVAELIDELRQLPQHLKVMVNDEDGGQFFENIDFLYHYKPDEGFAGDEECVTLVVNECV